MSQKHAEQDLSIENLERLIATMSEWSMKRPWTKAQLAAWRLRWFDVTPEQDAANREAANDERLKRQGSDEDGREVERAPFNDWPNGQGTHD